MTVPSQALCGSLPAVVPIRSSWSREASDRLMDLLQDREVIGSVMKQVLPGENVPLHLRDAESGRRIETELLAAGLAKISIEVISPVGTLKCANENVLQITTTGKSPKITDSCGEPSLEDDICEAIVELSGSDIDETSSSGFGEERNANILKTSERSVGITSSLRSSDDRYHEMSASSGFEKTCRIAQSTGAHEQFHGMSMSSSSLENPHEKPSSTRVVSDPCKMKPSNDFVKITNTMPVFTHCENRCHGMPTLVNVADNNEWRERPCTDISSQSVIGRDQWTDPCVVYATSKNERPASAILNLPESGKQFAITAGSTNENQRDRPATYYPKSQSFNSFDLRRRAEIMSLWQESMRVPSRHQMPPPVFSLPRYPIMNSFSQPSYSSNVLGGHPQQMVLELLRLWLMSSYRAKLAPLYR